MSGTERYVYAPGIGQHQTIGRVCCGDPRGAGPFSNRFAGFRIPDHEVEPLELFQTLAAS